MSITSQVFDPIIAANAAEAAQLIKTNKVNSYQAITYPAKTYGFIFIVPNGGINDPFLEVAVIHDRDGNRTLIESITAGWIDEVEELEKHFIDSEGSGFSRPSSLLLTTDTDLDSKKATQKAHFICGCCGDGFTSTIQEQEKHDQDAGYGICPRCEKYH